jgi:hypothetical protein
LDAPVINAVFFILSEFLFIYLLKNIAPKSYFVIFI